MERVMRIPKILICILIPISLLGCAKKVVANISDDRKAYILSQPHGWIEIELTDNNIPSTIKPAELTAEESSEWKPSPPSCFLLVRLNNEKFLYEDIFAFGASPPYMVETGFRFPAPIGAFKLEIYYGGCDVEVKDGKPKQSSHKLISDIEVMEDWVTTVFTDGDAITIDPPRANTVITIDDVYKKLEKLSDK
jgi:hypothetical protein